MKRLLGRIACWWRGKHVEQRLPLRGPIYKDLARDETWVPVHLPRMVLDNKRG